MPADLMAIAHVRRLLLELGMEEAPEQIVPAALGYSVWVSLPIAELAGRTPKWAAAGFEDTLLRCKMEPEVVYGIETAVQPGVQA